MEKWIEVFKAGEYPQGVFTEEDLDQIVQNFPFYQPPVVIGHPKDNSPAWGWVKEVRRKGKKLLAKIGDLVPEFVEFLRKGMYKHVSVKLRKDPERGWYLVHVGFLGGAEPQVKGLQTVALSAQEGDVEVEQVFQWEETMKDRIEEIVREFVAKLAGLFGDSEEEESLSHDEPTSFNSYESHWIGASFAKSPPALDSLPIADPQTSWDAQGARKRILDAYGWAGLKAYSLVYRPDACQTKEDGFPACQDAYKYLVVDLVDGKPHIIPKAVSAALAYAHGARGVQVPAEEARTVEEKAKKLQKRIQEEFEGAMPSEEETSKKEVSMDKGKDNEKVLTEAEFQKELEARLAEERKKLEAEFRARQEREQKIQEFLKRNENRIPPAVKEKLETILQAVPPEATFSSGEEEKPLLEALFEVFEAYPDLSFLFQEEKKDGSSQQQKKPLPVKIPEGMKVDEESVALVEQAREFMAQHEGVSFEDAVLHVLQGGEG